VAQIASFARKRPTGTERAHPTEVECGYKSFVDSAGRHLLQFDTYGSDERVIPGKVSQSLQVDQARARKLIEILTQFVSHS
jgi:hypothetical protein